MRNMQIKGDKQLEELKSSVEVMSDKLDEYEKDKKEKENIIKDCDCMFLSCHVRISE